jgi:hypothetical protein
MSPAYRSCLCHHASLAAPSQPSIEGRAAHEFACYYPRVYRYARLILQDAQAAEEVALRVMLRVDGRFSSADAATREELVFAWAFREIEASGRRRPHAPTAVRWDTLICGEPSGDAQCPLSNRQTRHRLASGRAVHRWVLADLERLEPATADRIVDGGGERSFWTSGVARLRHLLHSAR